jgi:hypothetical protein
VGIDDENFIGPEKPPKARLNVVHFFLDGNDDRDRSFGWSIHTGIHHYFVHFRVPEFLVRQPE